MKCQEKCRFFVFHPTYTLDGRKLNDKPTIKGIYIHNGNKVVIK